MSRRGQQLCTLVLAIAAIFLPATGLAAQESPSSTADEALADAAEAYGPPPPMEDCSQEQEAAIVTGEIIVCRRRVDQSQYRVSSDGDSKRRYAEENERMNEFGMPGHLPEDFVGPGIFRGPATVGGMCLVGPCPPPPAYMVNFDELPETPPGSDADRVGKGLAPHGDEASEAGETADEN